MALLLTSCAPPAPQGLLPVPIRHGAFVVDVKTTGVVEPLDSHPIALPQGVWGGNIEVLVPEGKRVKQGDFIAKVSQAQMLEELHDKQDDLAREQRELARARADAPVKRWEVAQEMLDRQREWREKSLTQATVASGGTIAERAAATKDLTLSELAIAHDPLAAQAQLYDKGVIAKNELAKAELDRQLAELNRRRARLALAQLEPGALVPAVTKARLEAGMARAAYEGARIDAPAKSAMIALEAQKNQVKIKRLKQVVSKLQRRVDSTTLYAPASGMVLYPMIWDWKKVHVGMQVWEGLNFLTVSQLDALKLKGAVSEQDIARVQVGAKVEITADGYPGRVFKGKVTHVSKLAKEDDSRKGGRENGVKRFDIEVRPLAHTPELLPNMRVDLRVIAQEAAQTVSVPQEALFGAKQAYFLWVAGPKGPEKRPVTPTLWARDWVALKDDLPQDAKVYLLDPTVPLETPEDAASPGAPAPEPETTGAPK